MTKSTEQQCSEMAAILGLAEPVGEEVLRAAVADSTYAHNLLVCRGEPEYLEYLLAHPPQQEEHHGAESISTVALARSATESLVRWARTGFSTVSEATFQQRLEACNNCPYLKVPPDHQRALYSFAGAASNEQTVCGKCGCVVTVKARRISDTCPDPHPERTGLNRWNEPLSANQ